MRILMLGNSLTTANDLPRLLAQRTGAEVVCHARGGARLSEQLNPKTHLGAMTLTALKEQNWNYVILQEMSCGPVSFPEGFFSSVKKLCLLIWENGAVPVLYATWGYQKGGSKLAAKGWEYEEMSRQMSEAYRRAARENHALLADVGEQFYQRAQSEHLYGPDGVHPSEAGSHLAAEVLGAVINQKEENSE